MFSGHFFPKGHDQPRFWTKARSTSRYNAWSNLTEDKGQRIHFNFKECLLVSRISLESQSYLKSILKLWTPVMWRLFMVPQVISFQYSKQTSNAEMFLWHNTKNISRLQGIQWWCYFLRKIITWRNNYVIFHQKSGFRILVVFGTAWKDVIRKNLSSLSPSFIFRRFPLCSTMYVKKGNEKLLKILVFHEFSVFFRKF